MTVTSEGQGEGSTFTVRLPGLLPVEEELQAAGNSSSSSSRRLGCEDLLLSQVTPRLLFAGGGQPPPPPSRTVVDSSLVESSQLVEDSGNPTGPSEEIMTVNWVRYFYLSRYILVCGYMVVITSGIVVLGSECAGGGRLFDVPQDGLQDSAILEAVPLRSGRRRRHRRGYGPAENHRYPTDMYYEPSLP